MPKPEPRLTVRAPKNIDAFVNGDAAPVPELRIVSPEPSDEAQEPKIQIPEPEAQILAPKIPDPDPELAIPEPSARRRKRGIVKRADGKEFDRIIAYVGVEAGEKLRNYCWKNDVDISEVAGKILEKAIAKLEQSGR